ncbi:hypothetical protein AQUCO_01300152v1 [Aquilegia coerulea]|uniref:Uncharacterized protein n=1 Tax=Aquilegia coerulea TaxID=218851 RepID=A0A2G5E076_AQUCA|nr:hypothetical protein AQUCO_01300152v1 [Aquilegia coerulea]
MEFNMMEGEGVESIEAVHHRRGKEIDSSNEMFDWRESSQQVSSDSFVGIDLNKLPKTENVVMESCSINDEIDLVEELTLKVSENPNVVVDGNSNSTSIREGMPVIQGWKHLYRMAGGVGSESAHCKNASKDGGGVVTTQKHPQQLNQQSPEMSKPLVKTENNSESPSGIRTKVLSSSGFPQFLVRNSLKGKGVVHRSSEQCDRFGAARMEQINEKTASVGGVISDTSQNLGVRDNQYTRQRVDEAGSDSIIGGIFLRDWIKPGCKVNRDESLRIFKRIVELVDIAHSQEVALQHVRPSCFKLLPSDQVKYMGSIAQRELFENVMDMDVNYCSRKRSGKDRLPRSSTLKQQKLKKNTNSTRQRCQSSAGAGFKGEPAKDIDFYSAGSQDSGYSMSQKYNLNPEHRMQNKFTIPFVSNTTQNHLTPANLQLEDRWYTSPEEQNKREPTFSSDIYCLGVLLFELFCCFESCEVHTAAMLNLRYRILPPKFLSEYPREAGFCLWLLHPEPSSRPTAREILYSELICGSQQVSEGQQSIPVDEDPVESELLLHFLISLKELKHKRASKLVDDIRCIEADIVEVEKRHILRTTEVWKHKEPDARGKEPASSHARLMNNINQLESAYFSMRSQIPVPDPVGTGRSDKELLNIRESCSQVVNESEGNRPSDHLGVFFDGLCKYARYNKFELRGTLKNRDLLNSANVICSLSFDRDEEYFAAAGVSKKIKIFELSGLLNDSIDIHYPVVEMTNKSKLSCVCWNNYIRNYLAATDYDGVVQLWDASTGQGFSQYTEHEKRAWSVDFSPVDPTKLASGSDDFSVKLWSINERKCTSTIRSSANVCCVQFSADSTHLLAFGSADYKTYCYDLRNTRNPWCTLAGHGRAVSYVKFLDSNTLVSASTDNTLKLWDLNKTSCSGLSTNSCSLTFRGHTNEKNFVGLSASDGYITCGSESNEVPFYLAVCLTIGFCSTIIMLKRVEACLMKYAHQNNTQLGLNLWPIQ